METNKNEKNKGGFFKSLSENISEGASFISEKVKDATAKAYVAGSEAIDETSEKIHDYTEKQSLSKEKRDLEEKQHELTKTFGEMSLGYYLKEGNLHKPFLEIEEVNTVVETFKSNAKRIKALEKEINKIETKK